jgi:hypothetical protein
MVAAKQIKKNLSAAIRISGVSVSGNSANVSTAIGSVLATAGDGGVSVPSQALGGSNAIGVIVTNPNNRCEVYNATTKEKIAGAGSEVYGRVTESGGVYTLSFFTLSGGAETTHSFASAISIDFEFNYRFDFVRFPADGIVGSKNRNVSDDPTGTAGASLFTEPLTVTALNTIGELSKTPNQVSNVMLVVNEALYFPIGGASAPFSISGKVITWSTTNAGFNLDTTDVVRVRYTTNE